MELRCIVSCIVSLTAFFVIFITLSHCVEFLWNHDSWSITKEEVEDTSFIKSIMRSFIINVLLLFLFYAQHSGMTSQKVKGIFQNENYHPLFRSLYVIASAIALQVLINGWCRIPQISLWEVDISEGGLAYWIVFSTHVLSWVFLFGECCLMDFLELMGLKQVYYHCANLEDPMHYKSYRLQRLYDHMRHPVLCLCIIMWVNPFMTLDRLLIAIATSLYVLFGYRVDMEDYYYQKSQFERKQHTLQWSRQVR